MILCTCCGMSPTLTGGHTVDAPFIGEATVACVVCERLQKLGLVDRFGNLLVEPRTLDED